MRIPTIAIVASLAAACERPPVVPPPPPPTEGRIGPVAIHRCAQDRPAIAGKWYDYNPDGHTLDPKAHAWLVRDPNDGDTRFAAVRVVSIYAPDEVESGLFTLAIATFDTSTSTWSPEREWQTPRNVKTSEAPLCVDLFTQTEIDCSADAWQVRLAVFNYFSPTAGFTVANFGLFARSVAGRPELGDVRLALVEDTEALVGLPDPTTRSDLDDGEAASWEYSGTDWAFDTFAPDLPEAGMVLGRRFRSDDVYWLFTSRYDVIRFTLADVDEATLAVSFASVDVEFDDISVPDAPAPAATTANAQWPSLEDGVRYLTFTSETLEVAAEDLAGARYPYLGPDTKRWDIAIERVTADSVRLLTSPASCVINATQLGLDETKPPVFEE